LLLLLPLLALLLLFRCHQQQLQMLVQVVLPLTVFLQIVLPQSRHTRRHGCLILDRKTHQQQVSTTRTSNIRIDCCTVIASSCCHIIVSPASMSGD
jgi:hypothetical protein